MANTTFNPSDKTANTTLSGGDLIATSTSSGTNVVRAIDKQITGKFYWECTYTTAAAASTGAGIFSPSFPLVNGFGVTGTSGSCGLIRTGTINVDGIGVLTGFGTITNGTVVCIAFDAAARLIWFRLGSAGNWNNSASFNPATGVGGVSTGLGGGIPAYPTASLAGNGDKITANFGDTGFTGTVPSGFTSGFTAGASVPTNALVSQTAAEHWFTTNPDAQVTQVAIEQWGVLPPPPLWVTQAGAFVWIDTTRLVLTQTGIPSSEALGTPTFYAIAYMNMTGIASEEVMGNTKLVPILKPPGIPSEEAVGSPTLTLIARAGGMFFHGFP